MLICHLNSSINLSTCQIHSPPKQILLCSIIVTVVHILLMSPITAAIQLLWFSSNPCLPFFHARIRNTFFSPIWVQRYAWISYNYLLAPNPETEHMDAPNASYTDMHSNLKIVTTFHPKNSSDLYVDNTQLKISQKKLPCTMAFFLSILHMNQHQPLFNLNWPMQTNW